MSGPPAPPPGPLARIVGLGNPLLTDDAVGLEVAARVHRLLGDPRIELCRLEVGGVELMETLAGCPRAVVIDAIFTDGRAPGRLSRIDLKGSFATPRTGLTHTLGLLDGLELGRRLGWVMPEDIRVYAVEVVDPFTFGEGLTPPVRAAVPGIAARIAAEAGPELLVGLGTPVRPAREESRISAPLPPRRNPRVTP